MPDCLSALKPFFKGAFITNEGYNAESGLKRIQANECEAINYAKIAIANPDFPERVKNNWPLSDMDPATLFHSEDGKGYCDYPAYKKEEAARS